MDLLTETVNSARRRSRGNSFDRMLDQVGLERDIRDVLKPARSGPQWRWVLVGALMAAVPALLAAILMLMVV